MCGCSQEASWPYACWLISLWFQVVVANVLDTRKSKVVLVTKETETAICLPEEEAARGMEIEEKLIETLVRLHTEFCSSAQKSWCGTVSWIQIEHVFMFLHGS